MAPRKPSAAAPRRSTRLAPRPAEPAAAPNTDKNRIAKSKKPAISPKKECTTCGRTLSIKSTFPTKTATDTCAHDINTCKVCTKAWVAAQMGSTTYDKLSCPECPELMANADVKRIAGNEVYMRYNEMERRGIAEKVPGWRWCLNPKCREGQVHEPLLKGLSAEKAIDVTTTTQIVEAIDLTMEDAEDLDTHPNKAVKGGKRTRKASAVQKKALAARKKCAAKSSVSSEDIFICHSCSHKACVPCDRPYHEKETCAQYQKRKKRETEAEEKATQKFIDKGCKQCPNEGCGKNIEKNGGCDQVYCKY